MGHRASYTSGEEKPKVLEEKKTQEAAGRYDRKVLTPSVHHIRQRWAHRWAVDKACPSTAESGMPIISTRHHRPSRLFHFTPPSRPSRCMYTQIKTTSGPFKHQSRCLKAPHMQSLPNNYKSITTSTPRIPQESLSQLSHWHCGKWNTWKCSLHTLCEAWGFWPGSIQSSPNTQTYLKLRLAFAPVEWRR